LSYEPNFLKSTRYRRNFGAPYLTYWSKKPSLGHEYVEEETMKTFVLAWLTLGLVLAAPAAGYASNGAVTLLQRHRVAHPQFVDNRHAVDPRAVAYAPFLGVLPYASGVQDNSNRETDGLSRASDDCVRWGCIDNGGS
jgi:hypothetical protein